jgi:LPXTG-motif cell wall-anchored protein
MRRALAALSVLLTVACVPAGAVAQSAGDQQYVDPFAGGEGGGGQEQPAQQEQPTQQEQPATPAEPVPVDPAPSEPAPSVPSEGGDGEAAGAVAPEASGATLPRTGAPTLALLAAGAALTGVGAVLRRRL